MDKKDFQLAPIGKLLNIVEAAGFNVKYYYDDLVFIDNTSLLFRFDKEKLDHIYLHFNTECEPGARKKIASFFLSKAKEEQITISQSSLFQLEQIEGKEEFNIVFKES